MDIDSDMEDLYHEYLSASKKDKPGLSRALDLFYGYGYVTKRERLTDTVRQALIRSEGTLTTADRADFIVSAVIGTHGSVN